MSTKALVLITNEGGKDERLARQKDAALRVLASLGDILPPMNAGHVESLADSMRLQGFYAHEPVVKFRMPGRLTVTIIGRHREAAAKIAGVEPVVEYFSGDPVEAVLAMRASVLKHRYLSEGQRTAVSRALEKAGLILEHIIRDRGLRVSREDIAAMLTDQARQDKPLTHRAIAKALMMERNHVQVNRVCEELVRNGSLDRCPHRFTEAGTEAPGRKTAAPRPPAPRPPAPAAPAGSSPVPPAPQIPAGGTFTAADIEAARTDLRGECTCQYTPVAPGRYVLPDIDRHCPVHNEVPEPLLPVPPAPGPVVQLRPVDENLAALDAEIRRRLRAGEPTGFRVLADRFRLGKTLVQNRIQWNQGYLAAQEATPGCTHGCPDHCPPA
jgi:hypothetical protein